MNSRQLGEAAGARTFVLVIERGEDAIEAMLLFAEQNKVHGASFTGIGAFSSCTLGFFDLDRRDYDRIEVSEQVELLSLVGNFALKGGSVKVHGHAAVADRSGRARGGHLLRGNVCPILELVVIDSPKPLCREIDDKTGLPLLVP